jgi:hypothetical protein
MPFFLIPHTLVFLSITTNFKDLDLTTAFQTSCHTTGALFHMLLVVLALWVHTTSDIDKLEGVGYYECLLGYLLIMYLLHDTSIILLFKPLTRSNKLYLLHHGAAIVLILTSIYGEVLNYYLPVICLFELSSIPLNLRYAVLESRLFMEWLPLLEIVFVVLFVGVRIIWGGHKVSEATTLLAHSNNVTFTTTVVIYFLVLLFSTMHMYWLNNIVKKVKRRMLL